MSMTYASLTGAKGAPGSLMNWVNYSKLDVETVLDEAQALIYQLLRCREMRTRLPFTLGIGHCFTGLPVDYLDPDGPLLALTINDEVWYKTANETKRMRGYSETNGTLVSAPFATTSGSSLVTVTLTGHDFNQGAMFYVTGATAVGGLTPNGTFEIVSVSVGSFVIDCSTIGTATSTATGGGAAAVYTCNSPNQNSPRTWSIWDERIQLDSPVNQQISFDHSYYRRLPLLSSTNQSNFLTDRYPNILRTACQASSADYMKDDDEYAKGVQRLTILIQRAQQQDDLMYRGANIMTDIP